MKKKVIVSLCLVVGITSLAIAAWVCYLNNTWAAGVSMQDMDYQILYREWLDCLGE